MVRAHFPLVEEASSGESLALLPNQREVLETLRVHLVPGSSAVQARYALAHQRCVRCLWRLRPRWSSALCSRGRPPRRRRHAVAEPRLLPRAGRPRTVHLPGGYAAARGGQNESRAGRLGGCRSRMSRAHREGKERFSGAMFAQVDGCHFFPCYRASRSGARGTNRARQLVLSGRVEPDPRRFDCSPFRRCLEQRYLVVALAVVTRGGLRPVRRSLGAVLSFPKSTVHESSETL